MFTISIRSINSIQFILIGKSGIKVIEDETHRNHIKSRLRTDGNGGIHVRLIN